MQVVGKGLVPYDFEELSAEFATRLSTKAQESTPINEPTQIEKTNLIYATTSLTYTVPLDTVASSVLTIHNTSQIAYTFQWKKLVPKNPLNIKSIHDGTQRFYFSNKTGVLLPGAAFDFIIIFKSSRPGVFSEEWVLETEPATDIKTILFQGISIENIVNDNVVEKTIENKMYVLINF